MADHSKRVIVDGVDVREMFHFPRILKSVLAALQPPRMLIALFMVLLLVSIGRLWDALFDQEAFATASAGVVAAFQIMIGGVLGLSPTATLAGAHQMFVGLPLSLWSEFTTFSIIYGLLSVFILAVGGAAIARMTAVDTAHHRRLPMRKALEFSMTRWVRIVLAPLMPLIVAGIIALIILVLGLLMWVPVLDILGGLLYLLMLMLGLVIAFLLLVYALAFVMVVPALAVEDCDGADAQQRAFGYVISRPLHLVGYLAVALIGLALGYFVINLFASTVLSITPALYGKFSDHPALTGPPPNLAMDAAPSPERFVMDLERAFAQAFADESNAAAADADADAEESGLNWHQRPTAWLVSLWTTLVLSIVAAYVVSYFFSAATLVYLLMRRASDGQDIEELWEPA